MYANYFIMMLYFLRCDSFAKRSLEIYAMFSGLQRVSGWQSFGYSSSVFRSVFRHRIRFEFNVAFFSFKIHCIIIILFALIYLHLSVVLHAFYFLTFAAAQFLLNLAASTGDVAPDSTMEIIHFETEAQLCRPAYLVAVRTSVLLMHF